MNRTTFLETLRKEYDKNIAISTAKNNDYAGANTEDAFANFRVIEILSKGKITVEQGIVTRLTDKLQRVINLLSQESSVKTESISDTLSDLANYAMILKMYVDEKQGYQVGVDFAKGKDETVYPVEPLLKQIQGLRCTVNPKF